MHRISDSLRLVAILSVCALAGTTASAGGVPESAYSDLNWRFVDPHRSG